MSMWPWLAPSGNRSKAARNSAAERERADGLPYKATTRGAGTWCQVASARGNKGVEACMAPTLSAGPFRANEAIRACTCGTAPLTAPARSAAD